jgi:hypothetical protein
MWWILPGVVAIAATVIFINYFNQGYKKKIERFEGRETLTFDQIYERYFEKKDLDKSKVFELWNEIEDTLELPKGLIRPTDSFDKELAPAKGYEWDDQIIGITWDAERRMKKAGKKIDLQKIKTVEDYIMTFIKIDDK